MRPIVLLILVTLAGCSSTPVGPTVTVVDAPMTASAGQKVTLGVHFQDPDDAVDVVRLDFPSTGQTFNTPLPGPVYTGALIQIGVTFPPSTPTGPFEIDVSVYDQSGLESAVVRVMVTIQ